MEKESKATGIVIKAFGNLLHVRFTGNIRQGEVAIVKIGNAACAPYSCNDTLLSSKPTQTVANKLLLNPENQAST